MENKGFIVSEEILASQGQRFANFVIDMIIRYIIIFVLGFFLALIAALTGQESITNWLETVGTVTDYLVSFTIMLIYYIVMEATLSRTVGKYITKTIVVMEDGSKPDLNSIIKRSFCRLIPFDGLSFFGGDGRGWHDSIPDTYVVQKELFEAQKELFYAFDEIGKVTE